MKIAFVLLPNRKPKKNISPEQQRFWDAQWLGRLKSVEKTKQNEEITGIPFDQPEIPYTALYLLGILRDIGNADTTIIDLWNSGANDIDSSDIQAKLLNIAADVYLFSPFTNNYSFAKKIVKAIKEQNKKALCVVGGHHASYCADECLADGFDHVITGRGEKALLELSSSSWLCNAQIIHGNEGTNQDQLLWKETLPAYDLLPKRYKRTYYARLFTTHGCPFQCVFCSNTVWHKKKPIFMPLNRVKRELEFIRNNISFEEIYVNDENFTIREDHYKPLSRYLFEQQVKWGCETRIDTVNQDKLRFLAEMGCKEIDYGLESLDQKVLKTVKKGINSEDVYHIFSETASNGIRCHVNLMVGLPGETEKSAQATIHKVCDWINEGIISTVDYFVTVPYPGTDLYRKANTYKMNIKTNDWDRYREDSKPVFDHNTLTSDEIYSCWKDGLTKLSKTIESVWDKSND